MRLTKPVSSPVFSDHNCCLMSGGHHLVCRERFLIRSGLLIAISFWDVKQQLLASLWVEIRHCLTPIFHIRHKQGLIFFVSLGPKKTVCSLCCPLLFFGVFYRNGVLFLASHTITGYSLGTFSYYYKYIMKKYRTKG